MVKWIGLASGLLLSGCSILFEPINSADGGAPGDTDGESAFEGTARNLDHEDLPPPIGSLILDGAYELETDGPSWSPDEPAEVASASIEQRTGGPEVLVLSVGNFELTPGSELRVLGSRPLVLYAEGHIEVHGAIDVSSASGGAGAGATRGAPGCQSTQAPPPAEDGGSGGAGAAFAGMSGIGGAGGMACGSGGEATDPGAPIDFPGYLRGGCWGGAGQGGAEDGESAAGGAAGGALELVADGRIRVGPAGTLHAGGAGGGAGTALIGGGGGGGSGGMILLVAPAIELEGAVATNGGGGGGGGGETMGMPGSPAQASDEAASGGAGTLPGRGGGCGGVEPLAACIHGTAGNEGSCGSLAPGGGGGGGGGVGFIVYDALTLEREADNISPDPVPWP